jgi:hypothetical protein
MPPIQGTNPSSNAVPAPNESHPHPEIDPAAPAGSENSLGAESIRDGRPATDDSIVEAMDEASPDIAGTFDAATSDGSD